MAFELPPLPYPMDALQPYMSKETLEYHYGKHHAGYVTNLNKLVEGTKFANATLEQVIQQSEGKIFNNAAQIWNHTFFWNCMKPNGGGEPSSALGGLLTKSFGSVQAFKDKFSAEALALFGSGWAWLAKQKDGSLTIMPLSNAETPLTKGAKPLVTLDVWEHAYYIDYRNARAKFVENFWNLINWQFVEKQLG